METVEAHVGKMEVDLSRWGHKLDDLVAKADAAGTAAKIDYRGHLDDVKEKYQAAQVKLRELKAAGNDRWETFRPSLEHAWNELEDAFKRLASNKA